MSTTISIGGRTVGAGHPVYIVAELSGNHRQSFDEAVKLVEAAKACGADAVKLQTYTADTITIRSSAPSFSIEGGTLWDGLSLYELYQQAATPWEWQPKLKQIANQAGMDLFSSAFDPTAVEFLEKMGVPAHKVASPELVDIPLIRQMARTGKPLIISTGMAVMSEIEEAVEAARDAGAHGIALLKCCSAYPAPVSEMNLRALSVLRERFQCPLGLSDHTMDATAAILSVGLGACIIEKHLTLSRAAGGPDAGFSLEPHEFKAMVQAVRTAEEALGSDQLGPTARESASLRFRRSLFVVKDVKKGEKFTKENVRSIRPADGLHPRHLDRVLGRTASRDIAQGTPLESAMVEESE